MLSSGPPRPAQVFVSYSHDSPAHMDRVLALCDRLRRDGVDAELDQYVAAPPEGWPRWTLRQIEAADFVLIVCTETYRRRFDGQEEKGRGLGAAWEGAILTQALYDAAGTSGKLISVVFSPDDEPHVPTVLRGAARYDLGKDDGYEQLYRRLTGQPSTPRPDLGPVLSLPTKPRDHDFLLPQPAVHRRAWPRIAAAVALGGALALGGYLAFSKQTLRGEILDAETRQPLSGVLVRLPEHNLQMTTEDDGQYRFEVAVPPGAQVKVRATLDGYEPVNADPPAGTGSVDVRRMRKR